MSDTVQEIKDKLSIVDVVGGYVKLTKAGKYHKGLCPFHKEKSPSFMVSPDRGFYHCFGCGKGGDIFSFIQDIENLDFKGALRLLAQKAGVTIAYEHRTSTDEKEKLFAVLQAAEAWYVAEREKNSAVCAYLGERGLAPDTVERFRVGYAPNEWRALSDELIRQGYTDTLLEDAGLTKKPDEGGKGKKPYDRLRGRIMFPIRDISGRTVGFSGRIFEDNPEKPQAKYINSPETKVFHKSRLLYGLDMAREGIRKYGFAMLVEGQIDLLMAHQSGYTNAVALSGTSFTDAHAALIKRHTDNLLIAFDGDAAGIAAAGRAAALALKAGLNTKIARLPAGQDPADVMQHDAAAFKHVVREATHVVDFYLRHVREAGHDARTFKLEASRVVLPFVGMIQNAIDREHFVERVAESLQVSVDAVQKELMKINTLGRERVQTSPAFSQADTRNSSGVEKVTPEEHLIRICFIFKHRGDEERYARAHGALVDFLGTKKVESMLADPAQDRISTFKEEDYFGGVDTTQALDEILDSHIKDLKKLMLEKQRQRKSEELSIAQSTGAAEEVETLTREIDAIAKEKERL